MSCASGVPAESAQQLAQRPPGRRTLLLGAAGPDLRLAAASGAALLGQPGLADAGRPGEDEPAGAPGADVAQQALDVGQLALAAEHRRVRRGTRGDIGGGVTGVLARPLAAALPTTRPAAGHRKQARVLAQDRALQLAQRLPGVQARSSSSRRWTKSRCAGERVGAVRPARCSASTCSQHPPLTEGFAAEVGHVGLQARLRRRRRLVAPHRVDQRVGADHPAPVEQQRGQRTARCFGARGRA